MTKVRWNLNCVPWGTSFQNFGQLKFNYDNSLPQANVWVKFKVSIKFIKNSFIKILIKSIWSNERNREREIELQFNFV